MEEIKKCPFCGGEAVIKRFMKKHLLRPTNFYFYVKCKICGVSTCLSDDEVLALYVWNKRVE